MKPACRWKIVEVREEPNPAGSAKAGRILTRESGETFRVSPLFVERHDPKSGGWFVRHETGEVGWER